MPVENIYAAIPEMLQREAFEQLLSANAFRLERIVSKGHVTPPGEWYDQNHHEWVLLLQGAARLLIEGEAAPVCLAPGDYLLLQAHVRHRVEWTDPTVETVWLALHYS